MSRGRKPGFKMSEEHRTKIANSQILNVLIKHALGEIQLDPSQASTGLGLMRKVLPDLSAVTIGGDEENPLNVVHKIERQIVRSKPDDSDG